MNDLVGLTILVTRPQPQCHLLAEFIRHQGGVAIEFPTIAINYFPSHAEKILNKTWDWLVFTSYHAVKAVEKELSKLITHPRIAAIGDTTKHYLESLGFEVSSYPMHHWNSEGLLKELLQNDLREQQIALIKGEGGRDKLYCELVAAHARVTNINVYQRTLPDYNHTEINKIIKETSINCVLATSNQTLENLLELTKHHHDYILTLPIIVISPRMASYAALKKFSKIYIAHNASHAAIINELMRLNSRDKNYE